MAVNSKSLLIEVVNYLAKRDINVWVFGGWAEELNEMIEPRSHKDFDLFYFSQDFREVDDCMKNERIVEIAGKHFHHKRTFVYKDVLTELFLVEKDENGFYTNFWGKKKYRWPQNVKGESQGIRVVTPIALKQYRDGYTMIEDLRSE